MAEENNGYVEECGRPDIAGRIDKILTQIYDRMEKIDPTSEEYAVLNDRAVALTEQQKNADDSLKSRVQAAEMKGQRWMPVVNVIGQVLGAMAGSAVGQICNRKTVNDVIKSEKDGHIITTKATTFMQKPRS